MSENWSLISPGPKNSLLLIEYIGSHPVKKYTEELSGEFQIDEIEPGKLWLSEDFILGQTVGPVIVSEKISSKAKVGWTVYIVGKTGKTWKLLAVGSVYPTFAGELWIFGAQQAI